MKSGQASYILPSHNNMAFCRVCENSCFGVVDIIGAYFAKDKQRNLDLGSLESESDSDHSIKSHFSNIDQIGNWYDY